MARKEMRNGGPALDSLTTLAIWRHALTSGATNAAFGLQKRTVGTGRGSEGGALAGSLRSTDEECGGEPTYCAFVIARFMVEDAYPYMLAAPRDFTHLVLMTGAWLASLSVRTDGRQRAGSKSTARWYACAVQCYVSGHRERKRPTTGTDKHLRAHQ